MTGCHINIEDAVRAKAAKRPGRPKKRDAERVRNHPVNYELGTARAIVKNNRDIVKRKRAWVHGV